MNVDELYRVHHQDILRYVQSRVQNEDVAQDIIQDIFVKVCEKHHKSDQQDKENIKAWLLTVARNLCIDYWRSEQRIPKKLIFEEVDHPQELNENDPLFSIKSQEIQTLIQTGIESLKWEYRQAIHLFDLQQLSYKESARIMEISEVAFASLLKRARKSLINEMLKTSVPTISKESLPERELKKLVSWFDILDFPKNPTKGVAAKSRDFFNGINERFETHRESSYPEELNDYLLSTVPFGKEDVVSDIGCGTGSLALKLSPFVGKVYAIDHSIEMIKVLESRILENQITNVQPFIADVGLDFSFSEATFDVGFCCMVLHHIFDPKAALQQIAKTIVPGGHLVIADLIYTNENWKFKEAHDFWSGFKLCQMGKWLEDSGFRVIHLEENHTYSFSFNDTKDQDTQIEVPLLYAHCVKE